MATRRAGTVAAGAVRSPALALIAVAGALLGALACMPGTATWTSYRDEGFNPQAVGREPCAVGGVVLRDGAALDRFAGVDLPRSELTPPVQADQWSPLLDDAFRTVVQHEPAAGWFAYRALMPASARDSVLVAHARGSVIGPGLLATCRRSLPGVRYLLLARVEATSLESFDPGNSRAAYASGRAVQMTLDVYDLEAARSAWTHTSGAIDLGPGDPRDGERRELRRVQLPDSVGAPVVVPGQVLAAPPLDKVMLRALEKLLRDACGTQELMVDE